MLTNQQAQQVSDLVIQRASVQREFDKELLCLVQTKGWGYAQRVADEIVQEFNCKPTDPNWTTYTTIQYAFQRLFGGVRKRATVASEASGPIQSITAEIKDASTSRRINSGSPSGPKRRRKRISE